MKVVSFIPIKLNNQRLPGKNTMMLNGRPMCDYLFETISNVDSITLYGNSQNYLLFDFNFDGCSNRKVSIY